MTEPSTILAVRAGLTAAQLEAVSGEGGVLQALADANFPGMSSSGLEGIDAGFNVKVWWSSTDQGNLVV